MNRRAKWIIGGLTTALLVTLIGFLIVLNSNREPGVPTPNTDVAALQARVETLESQLNDKATTAEIEALSVRLAAEEGDDEVAKELMADLIEAVRIYQAATEGASEESKAAAEAALQEQIDIINERLDAEAEEDMDAKDQANEILAEATAEADETADTEDDNDDGDDIENTETAGEVVWYAEDGSYQSLTTALEGEYPSPPNTLVGRQDCNELLTLEGTPTKIYIDHIKDAGRVVVGPGCAQELHEKFGDSVTIVAVSGLDVSEDYGDYVTVVQNQKTGNWQNVLDALGD